MVTSPRSKSRIDMNVLYMTVGLPRSGKSTWARGLLKTHGTPIVSPDAIRWAMHGGQYDPAAEARVWDTARLMVESLFLVGHPEVILDATNICEAVRQKWTARDRDIRVVLFDTPASVCVQRARALGDEAVALAILRMEKQYERPEDVFVTVEHKENS